MRALLTLALFARKAISWRLVTVTRRSVSLRLVMLALLAVRARMALVVSLTIQFPVRRRSILGLLILLT